MILMPSSKADVIIVDINLDVQKRRIFHIFTNDEISYSVDLAGFKSAMESIGDMYKMH